MGTGVEKNGIIDFLSRRKPGGKHQGMAIVSVAMILLGLSLAARYDLRIEFPSARRSVPPSFSLPWDEGLNLEQRDNTCGAHAAMAVLYAQNREEVDPYAIYGQIPEKLGNGYIYPWGITRFLRGRNIGAKVLYLGLLSDARMERWLRESVSSGRPAIVIIGTRKYLHYVTVLGYDGPTYHLYDSLFATDTNGERPGNITVPAGELLDRWNGARFRGFRLRMAITE